SLTFLLHCVAYHRHLHSFPTRRSSDLYPAGVSVWNELGTLLSLCRRYHSTNIGNGGGIRLLSRIGISGHLLVRRTSLRTKDALVDRKSTRLNSSHVKISYAVFCLKKKK